MNKLEASLYSNVGESKGKVGLSPSMFQSTGSPAVLHEVLVAFRNNQRRGTSATKTRGNVSGGGRKPWRQKGTGNARAGSNRSPLWRKGGVIFGPHPRSYRVKVAAEKRHLALQTALAEKAKDSSVIVLESVPETQGKTAAAKKFIDKIAPSGRVLMMVDKREDLLARSIRNMPRVSLQDSRELNSWDLMKANVLVATQASLQALEKRCSGEN